MLHLTKRCSATLSAEHLKDNEKKEVIECTEKRRIKDYNIDGGDVSSEQAVFLLVNIDSFHKI